MTPFRALRMRNPGLPAGTFLVGNNAAQTTASATAGDVQQGVICQASISGTANKIVLVGNGALTGTYRLTVYAASSSTVIGGALLGKSADQSGVAAGLNTFALVAPISIVSGNWYALMLHGGTISGGTASNGSVTDRWFSDTYSDGPLDPAPSGGLNSSNGRMIYLTS